jgi:hypothetical protein
MKQYAEILFSIFTAMICAIGFAADQPACQKSGKKLPDEQRWGMQLRQELRLLVRSGGAA